MEIGRITNSMDDVGISARLSAWISVLGTENKMCYLCYVLLDLILYLKTLNSHLCYFLFNIVIFICFSTNLFDNVTLCINLPNVTLSNMPHLVYITLFGETDGVTLSRLECKGNK